jgi:hypothetical protein
MNAILKRKAWKVAIAHFASTFLCGAILIITLFAFSHFPNSPQFQWLSLESKLFVLLQPQFWFAPKIFTMDNFYALPLFVFSLALSFYFVSVPLWSICFGWLFVKLENWLNHFPVLGKKVF